MPDVDQVNKSHRESRVKKKRKKENDAKQHKGKDPRAFAMAGVQSSQKRQQRKADREHRKLHLPMPSHATAAQSIKQLEQLEQAKPGSRARQGTELAPVLIAVCGPPKSGKSTLIRSIVKHYTKQNIGEVKGPVTMVTGKKRRLTLFECPNDVNSMLDICKVADLVLMLIDGSFGFEMETFEILNILQTHGMPRVMGILTHLDLFKKTSQTRKVKKELKHRFWTEIYAGAKLFYLSGVIYGRYLKREVQNLCRFISVMKFRPMVWKNSHSHILADRVEDITPVPQVQSHPHCDRTVALFGYVRGCPFREGSAVHIPGVGDVRLESVNQLGDPCPLPTRVEPNTKVGGGEE
eukprot:CAMPEP_0119130032 /NCGR_PEP_ID=MMETSP1310-20130426/7532_1 /TAXON_ID=464262 /ORGANISM="Genus nov. species nov., Strain RCC2339" /LENGTH=349 /DNA_ID=CAMNT_0007120499 /DNA_START=75 /DNA_END=1121 /DNA_ORIENTATION=-